LLSYLVSASHAGEGRMERFEFRCVEPLAHDMTFVADASYRVWRVVADESGRYDGLVDAEPLGSGG
jgi:hypothetical protein